MSSQHGGSIGGGGTSSMGIPPMQQGGGGGGSMVTGGGGSGGTGGGGPAGTIGGGAGVGGSIGGGMMLGSGQQAGIMMGSTGGGGMASGCSTDARDEIICEILCAIADFAVDLAMNVSRKTGRSWTPKVLQQQRKRVRRRTSLDDPNKPRKPQTAYTSWCEHIRQKVREKDPSRALQIKDLADMWKHLPEQEKAPWERKANEMKEKYHLEMRAWRSQGIQKSESFAQRLSSVAQSGGLVVGTGPGSTAGASSVGVPPSSTAGPQTGISPAPNKPIQTAPGVPPGAATFAQHYGQYLDQK